MHKTVTEDIIRQACSSRITKIREDSNSLLKKVEEDTAKIEEQFASDIESAGFSCNAFLPFSKMDFSADARFLPDGLYVGMLKHPSSNTQFLPNQTWTRAMGDLVEWLVYHDLWSKMHLFADMFSQATDQVSEAQRRGPKNMLDGLPDTFNEAQLEALRVEIGKSKDGTKGQLSLWVHRKFITFSSETGLYTKTNEYLKKSDV